MNASQLVGSTAEPAFAVDLSGDIVGWNQACERLLGFPASQVVGAHCWEVIAGKDIHGNDYCAEECQLRAMVRGRKPIHPCELLLRDAVGTPVQARVSFVRGEQDAANVVLVHLLSKPAANGQSGAAVSWCTRSNNHGSRLTAREVEVLQLIAEGLGTARAAEQLCVSQTTVRNHLRHIFKKLRVHSRLEAVAVARRLGLLESS